MKIKKYIGLIYALLASLFNATMGIFSVKLIQTGLNPLSIAFYKYLIAFVILLCLLIVNQKFNFWIKYLRKNFKYLAICSFFGAFVLHLCETNAYKFEKVPIVVFLLLSSATITTFILNAVMNKHKLSRIELISCSCAILGLSMLLGIGSNAYSSNLLGAILAIIAGIGYGFFLTLVPIFKISVGLHVITSMMLFGLIYFSAPFIYTGVNFISSMEQFQLLLCLSILPTIAGFWCTIKALSILESKTVQLLELSEPIICLLFAFIFLQQELNYLQLIGAIFILVAICINDTAK